ncbi:ABC transporter ATP-binding protein [Pseudotabrizicola alkalilacus]|uniref:ABC transporter ATP-binding protein n=1 Tax=Pseudotabrizicola alkalilacus TaxID=2305252 RepID=A0A411Z091_9RHOB|nr:ABC transporter ATP-binding protein [Pseudotabrizicola alkalilacus]RGP36485.1 ABC transporter ATP-binding protein [Pseudotabrizicola alkalilacus]
MLSVQNLQAGYGASQVLFDISLDIKDGEVVTLMGRNGMGKTTTVRTIMGLLPPKGGAVQYDGRAIGGLAPEKVARLGFGLVPEGRQVFPTLTVRENLVATAANRLAAKSPWTLARIYELFPRLGERGGQMAATLSGGEQQMLAVGRALMTNPRLLILDEATEGLAPVIRSEIWQVVEKLKAEGQSILLIDKTFSVLKRLADRHFILEKGKTVWTGTSAELTRDQARVQAWVGI